MKLLYFDCFSGVSGDMTLGALLDCGADDREFRRRLAGLRVPGYELDIRKVSREGIAATDVDVRLLEMDHGHGRHLSDIAALLERADLPDAVKARTLAIFTRLADAEAKIHGTSRESIHFHEVGAVDAIVDIVGSCILLDLLGIEAVAVSDIPCGHGTIRCQHGIMPVPAPATMELLAGFPLRPVDIEGELVTPTGAAIVTTLAAKSTAGRMPSMRVERTGYGAGKKQFVSDMPNLLRVIVGEAEQALVQPSLITVLETNLDDERPETLGFLMEKCLAAGAVDVFFTPIQMKKNRPAVMATVLCAPEFADSLATIVFRETGTFGIRRREQSRYVLGREMVTVATSFGPVAVKIGSHAGEIVTVAPEFEDCRKAAVEYDVPLRRVYDAAVDAYRKMEV